VWRLERAEGGRTGRTEVQDEAEAKETDGDGWWILIDGLADGDEEAKALMDGGCGGGGGSGAGGAGGERMEEEAAGEEKTGDDGGDAEADDGEDKGEANCHGTTDEGTRSGDSRVDTQDAEWDGRGWPTRRSSNSTVSWWIGRTSSSRRKGRPLLKLLVLFVFVVVV
jgi:hypothetical protein